MNSHGRPLKDPAARAPARSLAAPPSGWPPTNVKRGGSARAAATIARFVLPVSVTTAGWRTFSSSSLEQREVLPDRRREDDEVRFGQHDQVVGGDVDGVQPHRRLEHVLVVDGDDERRRPELARRQRNRAADQPEADDADLLRRSGGWPRRLIGRCAPG